MPSGHISPLHAAPTASELLKKHWLEAARACGGPPRPRKAQHLAHSHTARHRQSHGPRFTLCPLPSVRAPVPGARAEAESWEGRP